MENVPTNNAKTMSELKTSSIILSEIDEDSHIRIELPDYSGQWGDVYDWINREDAIRIIEHLREQFKL